MCWAAPPARVFSMTYGRTKGQSISLLSEGDEVEAKGWAEARFGRSLLLLGDLTTPLRHLARHWALYAQSTRKIRGLAVRFDGFEIPVASVVADDENGAASLLAALGDLNGLLVVNSEQDLPIAIRRRTENTDPWMVALCEGSTTPALKTRSRSWMLRRWRSSFRDWECGSGVQRCSDSATRSECVQRTAA